MYVHICISVYIIIYNVVNEKIEKNFKLFIILKIIYNSVSPIVTSLFIYFSLSTISEHTDLFLILLLDKF